MRKLGGENGTVFFWRHDRLSFETSSFQRQDDTAHNGVTAKTTTHTEEDSEDSRAQHIFET